MSKDLVLSLTRHLLTFGGGLIVSKGLADETMATELVGAVVTLVGGIWSLINAASKKKATTT